MTHFANSTEGRPMDDSEADSSSLPGSDPITRWYDGFQTSAHFERLPDAHRERAWGVIEIFSSYSLDHTGESPGRWAAAGVRACCLEILPRKFTGDETFFKAVAPVLSAFSLHRDEQHLLKRGQALARMVATLDRQLVAHATDPRAGCNWK
ncbi:MAG: hypothetical protein HY736_03025 [Verrucomicrobia bacterium]|nr:hypothetical protein [Verrucomicrobiota bacterium]